MTIEGPPSSQREVSAAQASAQDTGSPGKVRHRVVFKVAPLTTIGESTRATPAASIEDPMQAPEKFSILLVDDDTTVILVLNHILSGFAPLRFATSGRRALDLARGSVPDLVLLDVDMPEFGGFDVCKAFKNEALLAAVPIILITGHESVQMRAKGLELGAADFISKPPQAALLLSRVRTYQQLKKSSQTMSAPLSGVEHE